MATRKSPRRPSRKSAVKPARSKKAGAPRPEPAASKRVRRRTPTAHGPVRKDTTLFAAAEGPRVLW